MEFQDKGVPVQIATTVDCKDLQLMLDFWTSLLAIEGEIHEQFGFIGPAPGRTGSIWLQQVPEPKQGKNRVHLDFVAEDLAAVEARVVELGGSVLEIQEWQDFRWRVCADPEGNLFDIMQAQAPE